MKISMNSHIIGRIRTHINNIDFNRDVGHSQSQLREILTIFDQFNDVEEKEIVRHFHAQDKKINGIKTLRLMTDYSLADSKALYERLAEEIDREAPKVDVNLLRQMLTYYISQCPSKDYTADLRYFLSHINQPETTPRGQRFYADNELLAKGVDPMAAWLYMTARDYHMSRSVRTLGDILGEALKK